MKIADFANPICDNGKVRQDGHCVLIGLYITTLNILIKEAQPYLSVFDLLFEFNLIPCSIIVHKELRVLYFDKTLEYFLFAT